MTNDRFDTGMKYSEAVARAEAWWGKTGRHLIPRKFNQVKHEKRHTGGKGPLLKSIEVAPDLASGVLRGLPWAELTKEEKLYVTKTWHHTQIRVPLVTNAAAHMARINPTRQ